MYTDYSRFSEVYDGCGASEFSLTMGSSIIRFLDNEEAGDGRIKNHLDLCCGTGELCAFFVKMGYNSKGIDLSSEMLGLAEKKYPGIVFSLEDVTKPLSEEGYDTVTCVDDAVNHITDREQVKGLISNAFNALISGGYFFFDMVDPEYMDFDVQYPVCMREDYSITYEISSADPKTITNHIRCLKDGRIAWESRISEYMYTCDEMTEMLIDAGFEVVLVDKDFYDEKSLMKWKFVCKKY